MWRDTLFHQTRWLTEANKAPGNRAGVLETMGTAARYQDAGAGGYGMAPTIYFKTGTPFQDEEPFFHVMVDVQRHTIGPTPDFRTLSMRRLCPYSTPLPTGTPSP